MLQLHTYNVAPKFPDRLAFLQTLAGNVWWSWNTDAILLFNRIDARLFKQSGNNPILFLSQLPQSRLEELDADESFLQQLALVKEHFDKDVVRSSHRANPGDPFRCIAYFSMEFGLHESIRLYSGGLGILAGDHLKSASDLDLPLCAVGLFYRQGYFVQQIDGEGRQKESYPDNNIEHLPMKRAIRADGIPATVSIPIPGGRLYAAVWRMDVGRIPLFLLDSNIPENTPELRGVTGCLYGGDKQMRLRQEMLLGVGGLRALKLLGYDVAACHMNEGHAAFLGIERMGVLRRETGRDLDTIRELVRRTCVFTTHTPVPAGNETFDLGLLRPYLDALAAEDPEHNVTPDQTVAWGQAPGQQNPNELSMTVLGLNCSYYANGVAKLHGIVERDMWQHLWPAIPRDEVPIGHVTNGIHVPTWISPEMLNLLRRFLGPNWEHRPFTKALAERIESIPDEDLWRTHESNRAALVRVAREHMEKTLRTRNASAQEIAGVRAVLSPDALTIGFARRFATYKRATLILRDMDRLLRILKSTDRPVQILFAGKAHPADWPGKEFIHQITEFSRDPAIRGKILFLENYDIALARSLVRGVDIWLNTPRRPMEASGTSGMKACCNGAIHVSTVDGWWYEGYSPETGWAIGNTDPVTDEEFNDVTESQALYNLLETEIVGKFYDRPNGEIPHAWIKMMKASMIMALRDFSSHRMVLDYMRQAYEPALGSWERLSPDNAEPAARIVAERSAIAAHWDEIRVGSPRTDRDISDSRVGDSFTVEVPVSLGAVDPKDVSVQVYFGELDLQGKIVESHFLEMEKVGKRDDGAFLYRQTVPCTSVGRFGFTARVLPRGDSWRGLMPGFIRWAE